jgi:sulfatase maturation enzyme AslB (radical SAM superfamily)
MDKNRPSCYAPWITTYEWGDGNITPCCEYQTIAEDNKHNMEPLIYSDKHMSLEDRFVHPKMQILKAELMSTDVLPAGCKNCKVAEESGARSVRKAYDEVVAQSEELTPYKFDPNEFKLLWLDYRESNLCNFSCRMCGPSLSSTHAKIDGFFGKTGIAKNPHNLQMYLDRLDEVEQVNFLGGEPLLTKSMFTILKEIRKRELHHNMKVAIVTNGSLLHRGIDNLLDLLDGFAFVDLSVSIDVAKEDHNYWRSPGTWDTVYKNLQILREYKEKKPYTCSLSIGTAISWPTAYAAKEVFDMVTNFNIGKTDHSEKINQRWNLVTNPPGLSIKQLPKEVLNDLSIHWKEYPEVSNMFKEYISDQVMTELTTEREKMNRHDKWHKNSFVEAFPGFKDFHNNIPLL